MSYKQIHYLELGALWQRLREYDRAVIVKENDECGNLERVLVSIDSETVFDAKPMSFTEHWELCVREGKEGVL